MGSHIPKPADAASEKELLSGFGHLINCAEGDYTYVDNDSPPKREEFAGPKLHIYTKLREAALKLRGITQDNAATVEDVAEVKKKIMQEVLLVLTLALGKPPSLNGEFT
ncbi:hypothetical protein DL771_001134 [Monosporascus sp. 5C6A]|nr:hypothetical protein DL771_001134 [Monosporascus sp. 5C6A]